MGLVGLSLMKQKYFPIVTNMIWKKFNDKFIKKVLQFLSENQGYNIHFIPLETVISKTNAWIYAATCHKLKIKANTETD